MYSVQPMNYGSADLPAIPDNVLGIPTADLAQYKAMAEEFAPTVGKLLSGMSPIEQHAQLEARIKVMNRSAWLRVPVIGTFLQGRLAEYKARLVALEEEMGHYREIQRRKKLIWTLGAVSAGMFVLVGLTGVIRNVVQTARS